LLDEFEKSALSGAKFARLAGIKYPTFANWVARRRRQRAAGSQAESAPRGGVQPLRLFEAVVEGEHCGTSRVAGVEGLVVELPGGSRALVGSPVQLQMVAELVVLVAQGMRSRC
jgi:hypothetical protein